MKIEQYRVDVTVDGNLDVMFEDIKDNIIDTIKHMEIDSIPAEIIVRIENGNPKDKLRSIVSFISNEHSE